MEFKTGIILFILTISCPFYNTAPTTPDNIETTTEDFNNLYIIREVVYEVGILTDGDENSTFDDNENHEAVALTFYNPEHNDTFFDLPDIPVPIQTNVSGHVITGLAPIDLGSLRLPISNETDPVLQPENGAAAFPIQNALVSITTNLSTSDPQTGNEILQGLPPLLRLTQFDNDDADKSNGE